MGALTIEQIAEEPKTADAPLVYMIVAFSRDDSIERKLFAQRLIVVLKYVLWRREYSERNARMIEAMMPRTPVPLPPEVLQARRNAEAREQMFREFGGLTSAQVGERAGSKSPNRAALAHKWKSDGRIFSVPHQGTNYFPGYQFDREGQPIPVIAEVIRILHELSPWTMALWFTSHTALVGDRRPVDLLTTEPARVVRAAEMEIEEPYL